MPINCLIKCLINSEQFVNNSWTIRVPKQINGFLMNQFMNINVSKRVRPWQEDRVSKQFYTKERRFVRGR